jgi:hypothetical protein
MNVMPCIVAPCGLERPSCLCEHHYLNLLKAEPLFHFVQSMAGKSSSIPCHARQALLVHVLAMAGGNGSRLWWLRRLFQRGQSHGKEILGCQTFPSIPCQAMYTCSPLGSLEATFHYFAIRDGLWLTWRATAHLWLRAMLLHVTRYVQQVRPR